MSDLHTALASVRPGLLLSLLAILLGFGLGGVFGRFEDGIKEGLQESATAVLDAEYGGSAAEAAKVADNAWVYHKRAHMHWGGIGAATLAVSILLGLAGAGRGAGRWVALALGVGAVLYPLAWLLAGRSAPGLGSTGAGKEQWGLLFQLPAGLLILGTVAAIVLVARAPRG